MKKYKIAIEKDINTQYNDAVIYYQESINKNELKVDAYINLAFLFWNFHDFGFSTYYKISEKLAEFGFKEYSTILKLGIKTFPNNVELQFWEKYFSHILFDDEFTHKECLDLMKKHSDKSIVPYFFLYLFNKNKYKEQRSRLLKITEELPTAKNLYIKSLIE